MYSLEKENNNTGEVRIGYEFFKKRKLIAHITAAIITIIADAAVRVNAPLQMLFRLCRFLRPDFFIIAIWQCRTYFTWAISPGRWKVRRF
jgi:hypothetical protein